MEDAVSLAIALKIKQASIKISALRFFTFYKGGQILESSFVSQHLHVKIVEIERFVLRPTPSVHLKIKMASINGRTP